MVMCTCMDIMDMVRWILGPEWVLVMVYIYIYTHDECFGDGKVDTRPGMGSSYYHMICLELLFA